MIRMLVMDARDSRITHRGCSEDRGGGRTGEIGHIHGETMTTMMTTKTMKTTYLAENKQEGRGERGKKRS